MYQIHTIHIYTIYTQLTRVTLTFTYGFPFHADVAVSGTTRARVCIFMSKEHT